jgi:hypothetical protein
MKNNKTKKIEERNKEDGEEATMNKGKRNGVENKIHAKNGTRVEKL